MMNVQEVFENIKAEVEGTGGTIAPQMPKANWRYLEGNFTPVQLRVIADIIELEFNK
jgi:hypothetical protein